MCWLVQKKNEHCLRVPVGLLDAASSKGKHHPADPAAGVAKLLQKNLSEL